MNRSTDFLERCLPWIVGPAMLAALWLIFMVVPTERDQGIVQRIFYVHVPCAWTAFVAFFVVCVASVVFLATGRVAWDRTAKASAEVGIVFCSLVLVTGPIWARPIWGVWWSWDPRLTMTVILWTIYATYLILRSYGGPDDQIARYAAVLGIVGAIDIPVIIVSVRLWRGIHPAVLMTREGGSGLLDPTMRLTLYFTAISFLVFFAWLVRIRARAIRCRERLDDLHRDLLPA